MNKPIYHFIPNANFIEQMKYPDIEGGKPHYGFWFFRTKEAAINENTICIWTIKYKSDLNEHKTNNS